MKNKSLGLYMARAQKAKFQLIELELAYGDKAQEQPEYLKAHAKLLAAQAELHVAKRELGVTK